MSFTSLSRREPGRAGTPTSIRTNTWGVIIPTKKFTHYDVVIQPEDLPPVRNLEIIEHLQTTIDPGNFTPRGIYDGKKNFFVMDSKIGAGNQWDIKFSKSPTAKTYVVQMKQVATIDPSILNTIVKGGGKMDGDALIAVNALNVAVRMVPTQKWPFNSRSFFTSAETMPMGKGLELWRGYFQSVRPAIGRLLINIDITSTAMYRAGPLINVLMDFTGYKDVRRLETLPSSELRILERFAKGLHVYPDYRKIRPRAKKIRAFKGEGAAQYQFMIGEETTTIQRHLKDTYNVTLKYSNMFCAQVGRDAVIPLECLVVEPGHIYRGKMTSDHTKKMVEFATKKPNERLRSIQGAFGNLEYDASDYMKMSGMHVEPNALSVRGRILQPPSLLFGQQSTEVNNGQWNMNRNQLHVPKPIKAWAVVIFESRFTEKDVQVFVVGLVNVLNRLGIRIANPEPPIFTGNGQGNIAERLEYASIEGAKSACTIMNNPKFASRSDLLIVILSNPSTSIRERVKHWGDCVSGTPTQIVATGKIRGAKDQYFSNLALKINPKLGGINTSLGPRSLEWLRQEPTMIVGADVSHAGPGSKLPSISALVSSFDRDCNQYVAVSRVQEARVEIIQAFGEMFLDRMEMHNKYQQNAVKKDRSRNYYPTRVLVFRDGVSEGQFAEVAQFELGAIQGVLKHLTTSGKLTHKVAVTFIIVGKRHHIRFFPGGPDVTDKSGNCKAGLVIDDQITSPLLWDFYLQSHSGILGTSRSSHYSVISDENKFTQDSLQRLCYDLCHIYARATRSVSIPAPVYYADLVCGRSRYHFEEDITTTESEFSDTNVFPLTHYQQGYRQVHNRQSTVMYFM